MDEETVVAGWLVVWMQLLGFHLFCLRVLCRNNSFYYLLLPKVAERWICIIWEATIAPDHGYTDYEYR